MRTENGITYLTYEETARRVGLSKASMATLVHRGKFKALKFPSDSKKYISLVEVNKVINPLVETTPEPTNVEPTPIPVQGGTPNGPFSITDLNTLVQTICQGYIGIAQEVAKSVSKEATDQLTKALTPITDRLLLILPSNNPTVNMAAFMATPLINNIEPKLKDHGFNTAEMLQAIDDDSSMLPEMKAVAKETIQTMAKSQKLETVSA